MRISDVLGRKQAGTDQVVTIAPTESVRALLALLAEHNIGAVIVSTDGTHVDGIASERDVVRRLHTDEGLLDTAVESIMTRVVHTCTGADSVDALMATMTDHRVRHVPVVEDGRLVGVVSIGDVVKSRIDQLEFERDQLDTYLHQGSA